MCVDEIAAQHAHTAAVVVNRSDPQRMAEIADALQRLEPAGLKNLKSYVLPEEPLLVAPSVAELQTSVEGSLLQGDPELLSREVRDVLVAGMTAEHVLERLTDGVAVITPGTAPTSSWPCSAPMPRRVFRRCRV